MNYEKLEMELISADNDGQPHKLNFKMREEAKIEENVPQHQNENSSTIKLLAQYACEGNNFEQEKMEKTLLKTLLSKQAVTRLWELIETNYKLI